MREPLPEAQPEPRLPRLVEADPRLPELAAGLRTRAQRLWPGGELLVTCTDWNGPVEDALRAAQREGNLLRGLEGARSRLVAEARGLQQADRARGLPRGERVSRLLVLADDGAERFYRQVEALLRQHGARTLAIRFRTDAARLGTLFFGSGSEARLVMLEHKESVSRVLLALADGWRAEASGTGTREPG